MKVLGLLMVIILIICADLSAQSHRPHDFYLNKVGDTIYGRYIPAEGVFRGEKFKPLNGDKIALTPDAVRSFTYYMENANLNRSDPNFYYSSSYISIGDSFYQVYFRDTGRISILSREGGIYIYNGSNTGVFYFYINGQLSEPFLPTAFYKNALVLLGDCPTIANLLDHVPNGKGKEKTHRATLQDAAFIIPKYNECMKH